MVESSKRGTPGRWSTWLLAAVMTFVVIGMLLVIAGYFRPKVSDEELPSTSEELASRDENLQTAAVTLVTLPRYEMATGSVRPVHEASVASKLLARVVETNVTAGQAVREGEVLVRLDDAEWIARLKQSEASLESAKAQLEKATTDLGRAKRLKDQDAIALTDYDAANAAMKSAQAAVDRAAQATRESEIMLQYATLRSPLTGTVIDKRVEVGDTVTPGQVLLTLFDPTHMQMVASVRESLALHLKPGQTLPTRLDALDFQCDATVSEVVPEADIATRSFTVKVTGPCPPGAYSGMFGRLMLPLGDESVLVVPRKAIQRVGQLTMVDVVEGEKVSRRYIRTGRELSGDQTEVLSGLRAGERVVIR